MMNDSHKTSKKPILAFFKLEVLTEWCIKSIIPELEGRKNMSDLEGILLSEFAFIIRQLRLFVEIRKANPCITNCVDSAMMLMTLYRGIVETVAKVGYFFIKDDISQEEKIEAYKDYVFMAKKWKEDNSITDQDILNDADRLELLDRFQKDCKYLLENSSAWGKFDKKLNRTTDLIQLVLGDIYLYEWKFCSKMIHGNTLYRQVFMTSQNGVIQFNLSLLEKSFINLCNQLFLLIFGVYGHPSCNGKFQGLLQTIMETINDSEINDKLIYFVKRFPTWFNRKVDESNGQVFY